MGQVLIRRVKAPSEARPKKKTSEQLSGVPYTPGMGSSAAFTLKPLGEDFGFCDASR